MPRGDEQSLMKALSVPIPSQVAFGASIFPNGKSSPYLILLMLTMLNKMWCTYPVGGLKGRYPRISYSGNNMRRVGTSLALKYQRS